MYKRLPAYGHPKGLLRRDAFNEWVSRGMSPVEAHQKVLMDEYPSGNAWDLSAQDNPGNKNILAINGLTRYRF